MELIVITLEKMLENEAIAINACLLKDCKHCTYVNRIRASMACDTY